MFAVFKTGGKQYKVQQGDVLQVEKLDAAKDKPIIFDEVLLVEDGKETLVGTPFVDKALVHAVVVENFKDKKVIVFKKKRRKQYKKTHGHRQELTRIRIEDITVGISVPKKAKPAEPKKEKPKEAPKEVKTAAPKPEKAKKTAPAETAKKAGAPKTKAVKPAPEKKPTPAKTVKKAGAPKPKAAKPAAKKSKPKTAPKKAATAKSPSKTKKATKTKEK